MTYRLGGGRSIQLSYEGVADSGYRQAAQPSTIASMMALLRAVAGVALVACALAGCGAPDPPRAAAATCAPGRPLTTGPSAHTLRRTGSTRTYLMRVPPGYDGTKLAAFLEGGRAIVDGEPGTITWYAFRAGPTTFGIFDSFETEDARQAHLSGQIPTALGQVADDLLASPPDIRPVDLLAAK